MMLVLLHGKQATKPKFDVPCVVKVTTTTPDGLYINDGTAISINITVSFNEHVNVAGTPSFKIKF